MTTKEEDPSSVIVELWSMCVVYNQESEEKREEKKKSFCGVFAHQMSIYPARGLYNSVEMDIIYTSRIVLLRETRIDS